MGILQYTAFVSDTPDHSAFHSDILYPKSPGVVLCSHINSVTSGLILQVLL